MTERRKQNAADERIAKLAQRESNLGWWLEIRNEVNDSSIDRDVERSCGSKDRYATREAARATAAMNDMANVLYVYECRYCLQWHLTRRQNTGKKR